MSSEAGPATPTSGVRMRSGPAHPRRPRPISIATTGIMSSSMYEKGSKAAGSGALTPGARPNALKCEPKQIYLTKPLKKSFTVPIEAHRLEIQGCGG